jgi:phosphatidylserine/phosphatidylglycerophosphate/cardiolipin synthase-like enzyme
MDVVQRLVPVCALVIVTAGLTACSSSPVVPTATTGASTTGAPTTVATSTTASSVPATGSIGPVILEPDAGMTPIYDFMREARSTLTMTMYELADPTAEQILGTDAGRGVHVQVLMDSALENSANQPAQTYLASHGVAVAFAPASRITHQKTICTDDDACLIMSLNLVADDYASTRDVAVQDSDPRDVSAIESTFAADFSGHTGPATSNGDHLLWSPGSEPGIVRVIDGARHTLEVENEEMDSTLVTDALAAAARRAVDVDVCMTADSTYTAALEQIVSAGGHVHLYPDRAGVLYIHEKLVVADAGTASAEAAVGSINFSTSSMNYNRELDLVLSAQDAPGPLATLSQGFERDFAAAPALS